METSKLKRFAAEARVNLMQGVKKRLRLLGFDEDGKVVIEPQLVQGATLWNGEEYPEDFFSQWETLRDRLQEKGVREIAEEAAYTWFNRMVAIRILAMNNLCDPVLRPDPSTGLPNLLAQARMGIVPQMTAQQRRRFDSLMNDDTKTFDQFALLLTAWCHANPLINACFGSINDFVELLLPDNILRPDGFLALLNNTDFISEKDYKTPELIGWLYQFYISDRKDEVFAKKGKVDADEIPAATQIFTPNWIVKYMVQNTILPQVDAPEEILDKAEYLVRVEGAGRRRVEIEDLKVADLACGSGHILNECFDLLYDLYQEEAYSRRETIENIFTKNLTGIDIDQRARQLATFALMLKACQKDESFADAHCLPHILSVPFIDKDLFPRVNGEVDASGYLPHFFLGSETKECADQLKEAIRLVGKADTLGSIIKFDLSPSTRRQLEEAVNHWKSQNFIPEGIKSGLPIMDFILTLTDYYDALCMNPPYMPTNKVDGLKDYAAKTYPDSKNDLFSVFMEVCIDRLNEKGKFGMINMQSWMFTSSFINIRDLIIERYHIDSMLHLGVNTFDCGVGTIVKNTAFVIGKEKNDSKGEYFNLVNENNLMAKEKAFLQRKNRFSVDQNNFKNIKDRNLAYWASEKVLNFFKSANFNSYIATQGMATCDNARFLRVWNEVDNRKIFFSCKSIEEAATSNYKWFPYNKGGEKRRWYGNQSFLINWENDGKEVKEYAVRLYKNASRTIKNTNYYFRPSISWTDITEGANAYRLYPEGFIFDVTGMSCFVEGNIYNFLGVLNTKFYTNLAYIINPTLHFQVGDFRKYPFRDINELPFENIVKECIKISKKDWDVHETSWDFDSNELIRIKKEELRIKNIEEAINAYKEKWTNHFFQLHRNEEEMNRQFIEIYGLQDELTPDIPLDVITIIQEGEIKIEDGKIKWNDDVIIKQLISYIVGVYMGRYRLDKPGLHIAYPDPSDEDLALYNFNITHDETMTIDPDAIIPVLPKDAPFYDNLYNYVIEFIGKVWGPDELTENLNFIEQCLGKNLDDFLTKDFWKYHKKMYQNKPIYWEFASKKGAFKAIVYAHRMDRFTVEVVRSKYLLPYIKHITDKISTMEERSQELSTRERRELDNIRTRILPELEEYHSRVEQTAARNITFDLDDGITHNHALFGDIVTKLK